MVPQDVSNALEQIAQIHQHLDRTQTCRDLKALPHAASGVWGIAAAALQVRLIGSAPSGMQFVLYWLVVAVLAGITASSATALLVMKAPADQRRRTRLLLAQFAPAVGAGALITAAFFPFTTPAWHYLPGIWAICYGLGIFAMRVLLPRLVGWAALFYVAAGTFVLMSISQGAAVSPWMMGIPFGMGQLLFGFILYWSLERK